MSRANAGSEIESEYEEAKETARVYLRAVGVLGSTTSGDEYRERQIRAIRHAILKSWTAEGDLPDDPFASYAAYLGVRYLHKGYDSEVLGTLLEMDRTHPAYREVLTIIVCEMRTRNLDIPERLLRWEREHERVTGRWTPESTRDYRIGLVVDAMVTENDVFFRYRDPDRGQLERDLKQLYAKVGNPPQLPMEAVITGLNNMKHGRWAKWSDGKELTKCGLSKILKQSSFREVHGIRPETKVRTCFPSLLETRNPAAKLKVSICDAVTEALTDGGKTRSYDAVVSMWKRYRNKQPVL